jgi:hypothetical protein
VPNSCVIHDQFITDEEDELECIDLVVSDNRVEKAGHPCNATVPTSLPSASEASGVRGLDAVIARYEEQASSPPEHPWDSELEEEEEETVPLFLDPHDAEGFPSSADPTLWVIRVFVSMSSGIETH